MSFRTGRMDKVQYVLEITAQIVGAFAGSLLLRFSLPGTDLTHPFVAMGGVSSGHPLSTFIWSASVALINTSVLSCLFARLASFRSAFLRSSLSVPP